MSFWKPGEAYPDGMEEGTVKKPAMSSDAQEGTPKDGKGVTLSEGTKNLPVPSQVVVLWCSL